jgi:hypothetical protein
VLVSELRGLCLDMKLLGNETEETVAEEAPAAPAISPLTPSLTH